MHTLDPEEEENRPMEQIKQVVADAREYRPALQREHEEVPEGRYDPAVQEEQPEDPGELVKAPAGQLVQTIAPAVAEYRPRPHSRQIEVA